MKKMFRTTALVALLLIVQMPCSTPALAHRTRAQQLTIHNLAQPGAMEFVNEGPALELNIIINVEKEMNGQWQQVAVSNLKLVTECGVTHESCVRLEHGGVIRPIPWTGFSCSSQCTVSCRLDSYLGPGRFRYAVSTCDGKCQFKSPAFDLPMKTNK